MIGQKMKPNFMNQGATFRLFLLIKKSNQNQKRTLLNGFSFFSYFSLFLFLGRALD